MDSEKKFKLDDLPAEKAGGEPPKKKLKNKRQETDPRLEKLKNLDADDRVGQMTRKWLFDHPVLPYEWFAFVAFLVLLEVSGIVPPYMKRAFLPFEGAMWEAEYFFSHPMFFSPICLFFIKFNTKSDFWFEVTFDGLNLPRKVNLDPKEHGSRTSVKWAEISEAILITEGKRPVIQLKSPEGPIGEIFWDLKVVRKRAFKIILNGLIPSQHPLRILVEKEVK